MNFSDEDSFLDPEAHDGEYSRDADEMDPVSLSERTRMSLELLEATHNFPCYFMVKVIGRSEDGFLARVIAAVRISLQADEDPSYRSRETPNGRHVAVTLEPYVQSAEEVLLIYDQIRQIRGVVMVM